MSKKKSKMNIIELSQLGQDLFDFSDLKCLQTKSNYISISSSFMKLVI